MLVRVVDYVANAGGGVRFVAEMLRALRHGTTARFELVSHGAALRRYADLLAPDDRLSLRDVAPRHAWRSGVLLQGAPGSALLNRLPGLGRFYFDVPDPVFDGCDVVWFPWLHRHRARSIDARRVVASLHDVILIDHPGIVSPSLRAQEAETVRRWLVSSASVVASSHATVGRLQALFGTARDRVAVVPLSGEHVRPTSPRRLPAWTFESRPYLLSPINATPHKNYEQLVSGVGLWRAKHPLVVTGSGTDIWRGSSSRHRHLVRVAAAAGLERDESLFALGYVDDATYYALLDAAWALVMPTLAEGGGSFPVWEALLSGVPVVCSDIPVMREMIERVGARVLWFDPTSPRDLARRLEELEAGYPRWKADAVAQVAGLRRRSWLDVARDYAELLRLPRPSRATERAAE